MPMNNEHLLEVQNLRKQFDDLKVLKKISFNVDEKEVVSIIGPSGSGKSTLLRCLCMLERVDGGKIAYNGHTLVEDFNDHSTYAPKKELKTIHSFYSLVFQNFNLFPHYTVLKNITAAPVSVQKRDKKEVTEEARELLKKIGLADKENYYPSQLSGGQQQRVAIARALAMKPKMLFFDEPTSALDPELTAEILQVLKELAQEKMTMVIVTHEIGFARNISDRVIFMDDGFIVEEGSPQEVIDNPKNERTKEFLKKINEK